MKKWCALFIATFYIPYSFSDESAFVEPESKLHCITIPTQNDVNTGQWTYSDKLYTENDAIKAGINVANATGSRNLILIVRDYTRAKRCLANDNKSDMLYGQTIRAVIEISDFSSEFGINLPAIAASGTLNRKQQSFYLYKDGFYNSKIDEIIASVSGKVFDVQNYALYVESMVKMIALLSDTTNTSFSVNPLLIIPEIDEEFFQEAPITTLALHGILKKESCEKIRSKFKSDGFKGLVVERTYKKITQTCDSTNPSVIHSEIAKKYLDGISVKH